MFTIILLVLLEIQSIINILFILICSLLFLRNRKLLYLIYIILLPTNGFISTEDNLFGVFHVLYIVNLFSTLGILVDWNSIKEKKKLVQFNHLEIEKYAYYLILFVLLFLVLSEYRFYFLGKSIISFQLLLTRTIRYFVMFIPILLLVKLSFFYDYKQIIRMGFLVSISLIAVSIIFSDQLHKIGFATIGNLFEANVWEGEINRRAGFFCSLGDVNSAGGFLAIGYAFALFLDTKYLDKFRKNVLLIILILGILATGSRTALVDAGIITLIFIFTTSIRNLQKIIAVNIILILVAILFFGDYATSALNRFEVLEVGEGHLDRYRVHGRLGGWVLYLDYIFSNISVFLWGATESVYKFEGGDILNERVAHNLYIQIIYFWGIFILLILIRILFLLLKAIFSNKSKLALLCLFIGFFGTSFTVSDTGVFLGLILAIAAFPKFQPKVINFI